MLLNLSNHPLSEWDATQIAAAAPYGEVRDLPFPYVPPEASTAEVRRLVGEYIKTVLQLFDIEEQLHPNSVNAVHVMGEFTFVFHFVTEMKARGVLCLCSTSERLVTQNPDGSKNVHFRFVKFREY